MGILNKTLEVSQDDAVYTYLYNNPIENYNSCDHRLNEIFEIEINLHFIRLTIHFNRLNYATVTIEYHLKNTYISTNNP